MNKDVDPTILRSVMLHRFLKKYPRILNRPFISKNNAPLIRKKEIRAPIVFRKPLRNKVLRKPEVPKELENELSNSPFPQYCWAISSAKRNRNKVIRDELGEKNPYSHPVEGVRHNLRNVLDPINKAVMKKQQDLPVDKKLSHKLKQQLKTKSIVNKILVETEPKDVLPDKPEPVAKHLETSMPLEYHMTWKEIELCNVISNLRKKEIQNIEFRTIEKQDIINRKDNILREEAVAMEKIISENEKTLYDKLRQLVMEKELTRQKVQKTEELADQIGLLRHQIHFKLSRLEEQQKYGMFLFNLSPPEWRSEQNLPHLSGKELQQYDGEILDDLDCLYQFVVAKIKKPVLYFERPEELMELFTELENVNFVAYSHSKAVTHLAEIGIDYANELKKRYCLELDILKEMAEELHKEIAWEENHMQLLKDFCSKYVFTDFAALIYELENVRLAVESTYVDVLTTNDLNLGAASLMKEIELLVFRLSESSNPSSPETMKLTKQINQESRLRDMAQKKFEKTFREYEVLLKELRRSFDYKKLTPRRKLMARSPPNLRAAEIEGEIVQELVRDQNFKFFGDDNYPCRSILME